MKPRLTIGMAHFEDYHGLYFTIQALKLYHDVEHVELIVIDNSPRSPHGQHVGRFVQSWSSLFHSVKYIPFEESQGTTQTRERVFSEATASAVMCMDCHVLLDPGVVSKLIAFFEADPTSKDILSGPLLFDNAVSVSTHFDDYWRGEMHGVWGNAVQCSECHRKFTTFHEGPPQDSLVQYRNLLSFELEPVCECGNVRPELPVIGHQTTLAELATPTRDRIRQTSHSKSLVMAWGVLL